MILRIRTLVAFDPQISSLRSEHAFYFLLQQLALWSETNLMSPLVLSLKMLLEPFLAELCPGSASLVRTDLAGNQLCALLPSPTRLSAPFSVLQQSLKQSVPQRSDD